jgi:Family of unknown function (DUF5320)
MPGFDQKGPEGKGPMTGRRMGRCTNYGRNVNKTESASSNEQNVNPQENLPGRGFGPGMRKTGRGRARGLGRQNRLRGGL